MATNPTTKPQKIDFENSATRAEAQAITGALTFVCFILSTLTSGLCLYLISSVALSPINDYLWSCDNGFLNFLCVAIHSILVVVAIGLSGFFDFGVNRFGNAFFSELFIISTNKAKYTWQRVLECLGWGFFCFCAFYASYATSRYGSDALSAFVQVSDLDKNKEIQYASSALIPFKSALEKAEGDLKDELVMLMGAKKYREFSNGTSTSTRIEFKDQAATIQKKHQKFIDAAKTNLQTAEAQNLKNRGVKLEGEVSLMESIKYMASKIGTIPLWIALCLIALSNLKKGEKVRKIYETQGGGRNINFGAFGGRSNTHHKQEENF